MTAMLTIDSSTLESNQATGDGGGINHLGGTLTIGASTLFDNHTSGNGGGINNLGILTIDSSTLTYNHAIGDGGGIYNEPPGYDTQATNSTFNFNQADKGGGLYSITPEGFDLTNCTFAYNVGIDGASIYSGVHPYLFDEITLRNSIFVNNMAGSPNCERGSGAPLPINGGNNLDSGSSCGLGSANGSHSNTMPLLNELQDNGGPTETRLPQSGSPAINGVTWNAPNGCPSESTSAALGARLARAMISGRWRRL